MVQCSRVAPSRLMRLSAWYVRHWEAFRAALAKFGAMIRHQGGDGEIVNDLSRLPHGQEAESVAAPASGHLQRLDAELVGRASMLLGAGRMKRPGTPSI